MSVAIGMTKTGRGVNGSALFTEGMSSLLDPMFISDRSYRAGVNVLNRGGAARTRPGYNTIFTLPEGVLQGLWYFRPLLAEAYLVFAVAGIVYVSQYPFNTYAALPNISFYPFSPQMYAEPAVQSAQILADGTVQSIEPVRTLILQDGGWTRAAGWNGSASGHFDPSAQATAEAVLDTSSTSTGGVAFVNVTFTGSGYTAAPRVVFSAPPDGGTLPVAIAVISGDIVTGIALTSPGSGYTDVPLVTLVESTATIDNPILSKYQVPMGGPMVWSGDRLWVAVDNKVMASDISNPISFVENQYASEGGFFECTEAVTAMAEVPSPVNPFVAVFTDTSTSAIQSSIRSRSSWKLTPGFQSVIFPGVGCVSHRSVIKPLGELWWMSPFGLVSFNSAAQAASSSKLVPQDTKMMLSKCNLSPDLSRTAGGMFENLLLMSVPSADRYNQHTWVYDQAVISDDASAASTPCWAGIWTGTRPVQWASGMFNGAQRSFFVSKDADGHNRLWEAFVDTREDNGQNIDCFVETKLHNAFGDDRVTGLDRKKFVYGETTFSEVLSTTNIIVSWAGTRGKYKEIATDTLQADEGSLTSGVTFSSVSTYLSQNRVLRTREVKQDPRAVCSSLGVESTLSDWVDNGFSLLVQWTGQAAFRSYRIYVDLFDEPSTGIANVTETSPRILTGTNC